MFLKSTQARLQILEENLRKNSTVVFIEKDWVGCRAGGIVGVRNTHIVKGLKDKRSFHKLSYFCKWKDKCRFPFYDHQVFDSQQLVLYDPNMTFGPSVHR